ncbi:heterokaryon incompatibility protein-domain-containing protein [Xylaria telfairii]|nr:heterokaryon incompatibility protein-domain-containing protein [Xylaria telfairii]
MAIIAAVKRCWKVVWITAFFLVLFVVWILGCATFIPTLMLLNFTLSCLIIVQGLVPFGLGRPLTRFTSSIQKPIQSALYFWFFAFHLPLVFPLSMLLAFAPAMFAESSQVVLDGLFLRLSSVLRRLCGIKLPDAVNSLPKVVVWMWRYTFSLVVVRSRRLFVATLKTALLKSTTAQRAFPVCLDVLWGAYNSRSADWVATRFVPVRAFVSRLLQWTLSSFAVLLVAAGLQFGDHSFILLMYISYLPIPILALVFAFSDAARELDWAELSIAQKANACIYASLPVGSGAKQGSDVPASIRLLEIHPGRAELPISCTLRVAKLSGADTCSYEALSYQWGPIDTSQVIYINQKDFRVSARLFRAIHHLRVPGKSRTVWIDAICVNQDDLVERSSQVLLMPQIYSNATYVIVWLGESPRCLTRTLSDVRETTEDIGSHIVNPNAIHYGATRVISQLLSQPWWTRVWVVQELMLAKKAVIRCDRDEITWEHFCLLVDKCVSVPYFRTKHSNYEDFQALRTLREERLSLASSSSRKETSSPGGLKPQSNNSYDLLTMIYHFRAREATNALDKVFAFQGLTGDTSGISSEGVDSHLLDQILVYPDYTRRDSSLSIELAKAHIRSTKTLSIIALAEVARQTDPQKPDNTNSNWEKYVPSWCPAFMNKESVRQGLQLRPLWSGLPQSDDHGFSASDRITVRDSNFDSKFPTSSPEDDSEAWGGGSSYQLPVHIIPHLSLRIKSISAAAGISLSHLGSMTRLVLMRQESTIAPFFRSNSSWESVLPSWRKLAHEGYQGRGAKGTSFEELFNLTVTGGRFASVPPPSLPNTDHENGSRGIHTAAAQNTTSLNQYTSSQLYNRARADACIGRRFFITESGHMGIGPASLAVGDEVHIVLGLQVPALLRKASNDTDRGTDYNGASDDDWLYVGQAYVHELMWYEGVLENDIRTGKVQLQELLLV